MVEVRKRAINAFFFFKHAVCYDKSIIITVKNDIELI